MANPYLDEEAMRAMYANANVSVPLEAMSTQPPPVPPVEAPPAPQGPGLPPATSAPAVTPGDVGNALMDLTTREENRQRDLERIGFDTPPVAPKTMAEHMAANPPLRDWLGIGAGAPVTLPGGGNVNFSDPDAAARQPVLHGPGSSGPEVYPQLEDPVMLQFSGGSGGRLIPGGMGPYSQAIQTTQGQPYPEEAIREQMEANRNMAEAAKRDREAKEYRARFETGKAINQARIEAESAREEAALAKKHADTLAIKRAEYENTPIDPNRVWSNMSTFQQVAATIAIALGGGLAAVKGGPNLAYGMIKDKVDADIAAQHANREAMGKSMTMLGMENEERAKTLEQERLERMKSLEGLFHTKLQAYNVPGNEAHAAFLRELAEKYHEEVANLILAVSKQEADKVVVEEQNRYREAKVVGASAGRATNARDVFWSTKAALMRSGVKEDEAEKRAQASLLAANVSKRDVALATLEVNQRNAGNWPRPVGTGVKMPEGGDALKNTMADPDRQLRMQANVISMGNGLGIYAPNMSQGIKSQIYSTRRAAQDIDDVIKRAEAAGLSGHIPITESRAVAGVQQLILNLRSNDIIKRDTLTDSDRRYFDEHLPSLNNVIDVNGVNLAALREWKEFAERASLNAATAAGGIEVAETYTDDGLGNKMPAIVFTGKTYQPSGARFDFTKDTEGEDK